jgi:O-antigen/teichoic acid export membrane protein
MQIGRKDIFWNYAATFLKIGASALLLPFILRLFPPEMVGIWSVFMTITVFTGLLDFGFNPSFTRNITYVFSGVKTLKINGIEPFLTENKAIDYGLLKGVISVMRWFYLRMAVILFILLATLGTYYIYKLLQNFNGEKHEVYVAWVLLCIINTYNLYTLYYDSLLQGKGLIKRSKQIVIIGQLVYLIIGILFLVLGYRLVAIVLAQASSVIIIRWLSYRSFFTGEIVRKLSEAVDLSRRDVLNAIYPNAVKIGLTSLGSFMVQRSAIVIGSLYLPLEDIASYGITLQLLSIVAGLATIYTSTYQPKIVQMRVVQNSTAIKQIYLKGQIVLLLTFLAGGALLLLFGEKALDLIGSKTHLIPSLLLAVAIVICFLENNHAVAGGILLSKNEVPFFKAALYSGGITVLLLLLLFQFSNIGLWPIIIAPGIAQGLYQNWKWPFVVIKELNISRRDIFRAIYGIFNKNTF